MTHTDEKVRLSNGLTPEQDAAFYRLAEAIRDHMDEPCDGCYFHRTSPGEQGAP